MTDDTKVQQYVLLAKGARGRALADLVGKATAEAGLFGFQELLLLPQIAEMSQGELAPYHRLLELFAYGTYKDLTGAAPGTFPEMNQAQLNKLKQLTVVSLALQHKVITYSMLQKQLGIDSVRSLEDYLISEVFYPGLVKGKLDQRQATLQVHDVVGRDVCPDQLPSMEQGLKTWLAAAEGVLTSIEDRVNAAVAAAQAAAQSKEKNEKEIEEMRRNVKTEVDIRKQDALDDFAMDGLDDDVAEGYMAGYQPRMGGGGGGGMMSGFLGGGPGERGERFERHKIAQRSKKRIQR